MKEKFNLVTANMPSDYIDTNGYEYILKNKFDRLQSQTKKQKEIIEKLTVFVQETAVADWLVDSWFRDRAKQLLAELDKESEE